MDTSLVTVYHSEKSSGRKHIGILYRKNRTGAAPSDDWWAIVFFVDSSNDYRHDFLQLQVTGHEHTYFVSPIHCYFCLLLNYPLQRLNPIIFVLTLMIY